MLRQRIITALILIPITLAILFYLPPMPFAMLMSFVTLGAAWEWTNLMGLKKVSRRWLYLALVAAIFIVALFKLPVLLLFVSTFIWWLFATILIILYPRGSKWWSSSVLIRGLMGLFVLIPCWAAIIYIRIQQNDGIYALLFLFVLIWGADSAAYFVGKKWGKHKLAPHVSPGKSVEGMCGAIIFSLLIAVAVFWLCKIPLRIWPWGVALALVTVLFSIMGDLFESMLKREAGLKDSGGLLPGHGGLLDRIDSLTAAAPVFVLGALVLGTYLE